MSNLNNYLNDLGDDIFRLLPMKEDELSGVRNYLNDCLEDLISDMIGSVKTFPILNDSRKYIRVINKLNYLLSEKDVPLKKWRSVILFSTNTIKKMAKIPEGGELGV